MFPAIARWVRGGRIEVGESEYATMVARALDEGGMVFEAKGFTTLDEAMIVLEQGLAEFWRNEGVELE